MVDFCWLEVGNLEKIKIALCDDQVLDRVIIKLYLEMFFSEKGIETEIDEFVSGTELLASDISSYSIAFLDIYMDSMTGIEAAQRILAVNKNIKIMFCSSSPEFSQEFLDIGAYGYFIKPISSEKLSVTMNKLYDEMKDCK